ncbi:hypothetical protein CCACVL1_25779 [Corchorus capsularis]|uniref:Uncharacterized protein n=1 Tax=Corchorus capsularis TaxID=210143 RepID=A0A1R3GHC7_COCAP|nr:hypothetical protein CCACVL1_25779 [Corchorus capsularis]
MALVDFFAAFYLDERLQDEIEKSSTIAEGS